MSMSADAAGSSLLSPASTRARAVRRARTDQAIPRSCDGTPREDEIEVGDANPCDCGLQGSTRLLEGKLCLAAPRRRWSRETARRARRCFRRRRPAREALSRRQAPGHSPSPSSSPCRRAPAFRRESPQAARSGARKQLALLIELLVHRDVGGELDPLGGLAHDVRPDQASIAG